MSNVTSDVIEKEIKKYSKDQNLTCVQAFEIAEKLNIGPIQIGKSADHISIKFNECQLGLFGYKPNKKTVHPKKNSDQKVVEEIERLSKDKKLPCRLAWDISGRFGISKIDVSCTCEALGIKIKPCQLGAF